MRVTSIEVQAFGGLEDRMLSFKPGLNVIWGPNESGKSTWHAALTALLSGIPEPGQRRLEDIQFAGRHRPWSGAPWRLGGRLELENEMTVDVRRDLDQPARDAVLAPGERDLGAGLAWEGSPDCTRWVGLNRRTFPLTAAVAQADVLRILMEPALLQEDLRRAAQGTAPESSVVRALDLLRVDLEDELRAAIAALGDARAHLDGVLAVRDGHVRRGLEAEDARAEAVRLQLALRALEGAIAIMRAEQMEARARRAAELLATYPERPGREEPPDLVEEQVRAALREWAARPEAPELTGPTAIELRARYESIGEQEVRGDIVPDPGVLAAREVYEFANHELDRHWSARPAEPEPATTPLSAEILRDLARAIEQSGPEPAGAGVGKLLRRRDPDERPHPITYARTQGLDPDPAAIRALADRVAEVEKAQAEQKRWNSRQKRLRQEVVNAESRLRSALASRGLQAPHGQIMQTVFRYVRETEERARLAARINEKEQVLEQLKARELLEAKRATSLAAIEHAAAGLRAAAKAAKLKGSEPDELATRLRALVDLREQERQERERAREAWRELQQLLETRTLQDVEAEAKRRRRRATSIVAEVGEEQIAAVAVIGDGSEQVSNLRREAEAATRAAAAALARLESEVVLEHPAEAEELWGEAARRVFELDDLRTALALAKERIEASAAAVNADVAPAVAAVLRRWLPRITLGRYTDAWVDPATLQVDVRAASGEWQPAGLLSRGTAEQVYLLLRLALVEHLTLDGRSVPLLLDDVTVQSDAVRTEALLEILLEVSSEHQVILFTRETEVLAWAERRLGSRQESVQRLDETPVRA